MTTATTFSRQNDAGLCAHYLVYETISFSQSSPQNRLRISNLAARKPVGLGEVSAQRRLGLTNALPLILYINDSVCQTAHAFECFCIGVCLSIRATHWRQVCWNNHWTHTHCFGTHQLTLMIGVCTQGWYITGV